MNISIMCLKMGRFSRGFQNLFDKEYDIYIFFYVLFSSCNVGFYRLHGGMSDVMRGHSFANDLKIIMWLIKLEKKRHIKSKP